MQITPPALRSLNTTFQGFFWQGYESTAAWWEQFCTTVQSNSKSNTYGWAAKRSRMREWLGERIVQNLAAHHYAIENKTWELTIGVDREDFEDDNLGVYRVPMTEMGEEARKHPDDLVVELRQSNGLCFDGQNFYDTDHPVDLRDASKGVQSNLHASGFELSEENLATVLNEMMQFKGEDDRPLRVMPSHLVVPPQLQYTARELLQNDRLIRIITNVAGTENVGASAGSNVLKGVLEPVVVPELMNQATTWYVDDLRKVVKPFVMQQRRRLALTAKVNMGDDNVFHDRQFLWGADARYNAGYALWFLSMKCVG